jgi:hypothetical protein
MYIMRKKVLLRFAAVFFASVMLFVFDCPVSNADVAWEPEDDFYKRHAQECRLVREKDLIANGPGGSITIWESPVSDKEVGTKENGSEVYVEYTYTDKRGHEWGIVPLAGYKCGWVPMDYLVKEPGLQNFINKHRDEYQEYNEEFIPPEGVETVCFWSYPGSGEVISKMAVYPEDSIGISTSYTDKDGRQWGYVGYFRLAEGWICMSDPANDRIPVNEEDAADVVMPPEPTEIIKPQSDGTAVVLAAVLVAAVVVGTVILVLLLYRKRTAKVNPDKAQDEIK